MSSNRTLLLMRHGKSSWATPTQADFDRPLKTRGERAAEQMGRWLDQTGHVPDLVLTSTAVRARSTTDIVASVLGLPSAVIVEEPRIYDASTNQLLYCIAEHGGDTNTLMVVGHNPGLESLTWLLARQTPPPGLNNKFFPTATVAVLKTTQTWQDMEPESCDCAAVSRPRELSEPSEQLLG